MTMYIIITLNANKQYKHVLRNQNGLASIIDHFLCRLSTFCEKLKKICVVEV